MARAKKLWRPLKDWKRHEWAPMEEVWQRAEKVIGSDLRDMRHDLRQDFIDERLIMAVRLFAPDGTETQIKLEPECWQWLKIHYAHSIGGLEEIPEWKTEWKAETRKRKWERLALVVRRRELDKHYPAATTPTAHAGAETHANPAGAATPSGKDTPRRRPGPKPTGDWPVLLGAWLVNLARNYPQRLDNVVTRSTGIDELVEDARAFLVKHARFAPKEPRDIRAYLTEYLQFVGTPRNST
jgi:hypothetical protein